MATGFSPVTTLNNGATFAAQVTPQVIWQKTVDRFEENADFYQSMEGGADTSVIMTKTDLGADRGQKLRIRVGSGYYDEPHYGDAAFTTIRVHAGAACWLDAHVELDGRARDKAEWVKLFKRDFRFVGGEIVGEFLMSLGYLPGAHRADCPAAVRIAKLEPVWMRYG